MIGGDIAMKKNKKLKGMTLYEMIIAIAIFAVMAGVLIGVGTHIDNTAKSTSDLKNKIVAESPYAANKIKTNKETNAQLASEDITVNVRVTRQSGNAFIEDEADPSKAKTISYNESNTNISFNAKKYRTAEVYHDDDDLHDRINLEFVDDLEVAP
jgi:prepilin-type N-terminal cleavage/methylation domain-containing protein